MGPFGIIAVVIVIGLAYLLVGGTNAFGAGMNLSQSQLEQYASNAGFSDAEAPIAAAIAMAESSGDPSSLGDPNLGISVGLWQINLRAHPEYTQQDLLDPQTNANAAFSVYQQAGSSFNPWTTFKTGAYQEYIS